ncbi:MAG: GSCFA domain-containing protein [Bacteroidota bacterium]
MKTFRTEVPVPTVPFELHIHQPMLSMGSCFSEEIGRRFLNARFNIVINPFGQQYNPVSISKSLIRLTEQRLYSDEDLITYNGLFHSFDHHGFFSTANPEKTLDRINDAFNKACYQIRNAEIIWITLGTAHVFYHKASSQIVNNCHKIPNTSFEQQLLHTDHIRQALQEAIRAVRTVNSKVRFVFTISPVRYVAQGFFENQVSKGRLHDAIYTLKSSEPDLFYFPSFELVMDELRDYRFYKTDMLHPSAEAVDFVWSKLHQWFQAETMLITGETERIHQMLQHRLLSENKSEQIRYYDTLLKSMNAAMEKYGTNYIDEISQISVKRHALLEEEH